MSSVVIAGNTSGSITLAAPDVAGSTVLTLPATSGTVALNGPAFSAYATSGQAITSGWTKLTLASEEWDTNSNYDTSTSRFTPTVAGYYMVSGTVYAVQASSLELTIAIYKNGSLHRQGVDYVMTNTRGVQVNNMVYMNGTTDYIELYVYLSGSVTLNSGAVYTNFQSFLARVA